jgi:hypothetical protein
MTYARSSDTLVGWLVQVPTFVCCMLILIAAIVKV